MDYSGMYQTLGKAICIKDRSYQTDEDRGIIKILFIQDKDKFVPYTPKSTPEDGIFILHNYESNTNVFSENEMFCIDSYKESENDDWMDETRGKKKYISDGTKVSALNKFEMIPIINCPIPDKKTGIVDSRVTLPTNKTLFIKNGTSVYGPFLSQEDNDNNILIPIIPKNSGISEDHIISIKASKLAPYLVINRSTQDEYLPNFSSIREIVSSAEKFDFISDEKLIRFFAKHGFGKNVKKLAKSSAKSLIEAIAKITRQKDSYKKNERIDRLKSIMEDYLSSEDIGQDIINDWLASKSGNNFLDKYVQQNKSKILSEHITKLKKDVESERLDLESKQTQQKKFYETEKLRLDNKLNELKITTRQKQEEIENDLEEYRQQTEKQKKEVLQKQNAELLKKHECLKIDVTKMESYKKSLENEEKNLKQGFSLKDRVAYLKEQERELTFAIKEKETLLKDTKKLQELVIQDKTLKQLISLNSNINSEQKVEFSKVRCSEKPATSAEEYIDSIQSYLDERNGKSLSRDEIANFMICITQNYLTCLAGLPGGGKTSSVVRMAEAMGLHDSSDTKLSNFLNIAVGQGWAGIRDLLGYFNAIRGEFQPAPTKLYEFLRHLEEDKEKKYLKLALLDEGNLSPLEHYWSDFLQMADVEYRNRVINLGAKDTNLTLQPGNNLRWITTINSDETTERLSPRLLDRVPVIKMDPELDIDGTFDYNTMNEQHDVPGGILWSVIEKWFTPTEDKDFSALDRSVIKSIIDQNKKSQMLHVSQRKLKNMRNYLNIANHYMDASQALDWCISMYILPTIEGYGKYAEDVLNMLGSEFKKNDLPRSLKIIDSIVEQGKLSQSYSFF